MLFKSNGYLPNHQFRKYRNENHIRNNFITINNNFSWDQIINQYEQYFMACYRSKNVFYPVKHEESILYK